MTALLEAPATGLDNYLVRYGYDAAGSRSAAVRGANAGGFTTTYYRDPLERPTIIANDLPGTANDSPIELAWNPASQIVSRTVSNNTYVWTGAYNVSRAYAVNGLNQYTTAGPASFTYDANGNLTSDGTTSYTYDVENRLVSSSAGASLVYDPLGRLVQTSGGPAGTTQFLYDGDKLIAEYNGSGTLLRRYVHGAGVDEPVAVYEGASLGLANRRYMLPDHQGSIVALINADGTPSAINRYDPWGIPGAANAGRFQYTGQAWIGELGMYYYKARIYSPTLGRFMQTDPVGYKDQINLYAYVGNDPVNNVDPTGTVIETSDPKERTKFEGYINSISRDKFGYDKSGNLQKVDGQNSGRRSETYSARIEAAIASPKRLQLDISRKFKDERGQNVSVDSRGGGITQVHTDGSLRTVVSGHAFKGLRDTEGRPLRDTPNFITMHEIVSHDSIRMGAPTTGNAIDDENIIRGELGGHLRAAEPNHPQ